MLRAAEEQARATAETDDEDEEHFYVWAEAWPELLFFLSLRGQWATVCTPMGHIVRIGLPNTEIKVAMELSRTPYRKQKALFSLMKEMEEEVLVVERDRILKESKQ